MLTAKNQEAARHLAISYHGFNTALDNLTANGGSISKAPTDAVERLETWAGMLDHDQNKTGVKLMSNARWFMERCQDELAKRKAKEAA